jgi:two-component system, cell cycle sensor histidine kinase and response regulator CckA
MAGKSKKDRINTMIDMVMKAAEGDYSIKLDVSEKNDELDLLADAINKILATPKHPSGPNQIEQTQSEERYRGIIDSIEEGYVENDLKGKVMFLNEAACRMVGYDHDEMIGMHYRQYSTPETAQQMFEVFHRIYETGIPERMIDYEVIRKDRSVRIHEMSAALLRGPSGNPVGFRALARDVTERRKAEADLRKREERYRNILDSMEEAYFEVDLTGKLTFFNTTAVKRLGYTNEEVMGMSFRQFVDKVNGKKVFVAFQHVFNTGETINGFDWEVINKYGEKIAVESSVILLRDAWGNPAGFRGVVRDITERKKAEEALSLSEERYRSMLDTMEEGYAEVDLKGTLTFANNACCSLMGYTHDEMIGMNYRTYSSPETVRFMYEIFHRIYETGEPEFLVDHDIIVKGGSVRAHQANVALMRDHSGQPIGFRMLFRDVTDRRKTEDEKAKLKSQLVQAQKMESIGRLAGGVAHDFNNMLGVILGYTELIKLRLPVEDPLLQDIVQIERAAGRSRDITAQLLAFSRKQIIEPKLMDLNDLITSDQNTFARLIGEDVDLRFFPGDHLWKIKADPSQIEQILVNLAVNARDAMPNGGKLTIETANIHLNESYCRDHLGFTPGYYVLLGVSDDGAGMDRETLKYIFEPFFTTKEVGKGTGLGLAMVYGIVKQNNGFINVYSEPGQGTTFKIYLQRSMDGEEILEQDNETQLVSGSGKVLLVEDDDMVRKMTTDMLETIGYTVLTTGNPLEALALCENSDTPIDLVITDVVMPGMSGRELRESIKAILPDMKILFMSGYTANVIVHHGVLEHGVHFLQKPFSMSDLAQKVREAIRDI